MSKPPKNTLSRPLKEHFIAAREFSDRVHAADVEWINSRTELVESFDDFYAEYAYVVVASGFRGAVAAKLTPQLVACRGNLARMLTILRNKSKCEALAKMWKMRRKWGELRASLTSVDRLEELPRIGPVVKWHLARNIGLVSCAKPDLHLVRFAKEHHWDDAQQMVRALAEEYGLPVGTADFYLWIWLSHNRGTEKTCCHGRLMLR
eukprot:gnl/Trimastix_PCT/4360.p1 GENE.gnl/Trimastix_PCT/4360~~gnl/Trimastix_PCT/4360.p1  ORF type:complete len:206 (+),score=12.01 gnl/Trimastix_PCT/4360:27-644(+)